MCCTLCEEPVRSITFGLAAVGIVAIVNGTRKLMARGTESEQAERAEDGAVDAAVDIAP